MRTFALTKLPAGFRRQLGATALKGSVFNSIIRLVHMEVRAESEKRYIHLEMISFDDALFVSEHSDATEAIGICSQ